MVQVKVFPLICIICAVLMAAPPVAYSDNGIVAITRPNKDVTASFVRPGRIVAVHVKDGDTVEVGQLLIQQDDAAEQAQLAQLEAQSKDTTQIEAARAKWEQTKIDYKLFEEARRRGAATQLELEHKRLEAKVAELSLKLAEFQHEQDKRKYTEAKIHIEKMRLSSPITGQIEKIYVEQGESVEGLADVVRLVEIDPLWIDVPVPLAQAKILKWGQTVKVNFAGLAEDTKEGKIIFKSMVVDAASNTLTARIELPNKSKRPAGEHVKVFLRSEKPSEVEKKQDE